MWFWKCGRCDAHGEAATQDEGVPDFDAHQAEHHPDEFPMIEWSSDEAPDDDGDA